MESNAQQTIAQNKVHVAANPPELNKVAERLYLSTDHGTWFIPRYVFNRPYDHYLTRLAEGLPYRLRMFLFLRLLLFEYKRMGITLLQLHAQGLPLTAFETWSRSLAAFKMEKRTMIKHFSAHHSP